MSKPSVAYQRCIECGKVFAVEQVIVACDACRGLLDVVYDWNKAALPRTLRDFEQRWTMRHDPLAFSGVWRFHAMLPFAPPEMVVTVGEGQTLLQQAPSVAEFCGLAPTSVYLRIGPCWWLL